MLKIHLDVEQPLSYCLSDDRFRCTFVCVEGGLTSPAPVLLPLFLAVIAKTYTGSWRPIWVVNFLDHKKIISALTRTTCVNLVNNSCCEFISVWVPVMDGLRGALNSRIILHGISFPVFFPISHRLQGKVPLPGERRLRWPLSLVQSIVMPYPEYEH